MNVSLSKESMLTTKVEFLKRKSLLFSDRPKDLLSDGKFSACNCELVTLSRRGEPTENSLGRLTSSPAAIGEEGYGGVCCSSSRQCRERRFVAFSSFLGLEIRPNPADASVTGDFENVNTLETLIF